MLLYGINCKKDYSKCKHEAYKEIQCDAIQQLVTCTVCWNLYIDSNKQERITI